MPGNMRTYQWHLQQMIGAQVGGQEAKLEGLELLGLLVYHHPVCCGAFWPNATYALPVIPQSCCIGAWLQHLLLLVALCSMLMCPAKCSEAGINSKLASNHLPPVG